ncbi:hypothetical protein Tco_0213471 [Tanacetum coccineum]
MDLKWKIAMISIRLKKFYKKTGRRMQFDAKELVGFDKTNVECFNCHNTSTLLEKCRSKGNQESIRRDTGNTRYKEKDNRRRPGKQEEPKALVTLEWGCVDLDCHPKMSKEHYLALNGSPQATQARTLRFMKIDLDDKTNVLTYHKKLLAEAVKEKEELKTKLKNFQSSSKGLSKLLNSQMSTRDKSGLGYGNQIHEGVLSCEKEVLESVFDSQSSDVEDSLVNDRFVKVKGMHAVPPLMTGIYMPSKSDFRIDESKFTYGPKQSKTSEYDAKTSDTASCESNSSVETLDSVSKPTVNEPTTVSKSKVWSDAPIIEDYESDIDDEYNGMGIGQGENRPVWNNVQRLNHQNKFVPKAVLTKISIFTVNAATQNPSSQAAETSTARKDDLQKALKNKGIVDSGCSRHMTGNKAHLVEYQDYNGGPVAFGELQHFNLFSVLQMCDKKNKVLFIDTECLVLSPDFKLPDENQVLLRVPRQNNMYSFNLENIVPTGGPSLDAFDDRDADLTHGMDYMDTEEAVTEGRQSKETKEQNVTHDTEVLEKGGSNEETVNVAGNIGVSTAVNISTASRPKVNTATPMTPPTTTNVFEDEDIFIADALVMLSDKAKLKGVEIKEMKDAERPARSVLTLKPLPKIDPKDKGKGVLEEEPELVQAKLDEEARLERQRQEQASLNYIENLYDEVQARIDADHELAVRWTQEEQEKYIVDERAKLLAEYFERRKKQLAEERSTVIRNKPLTKSQLRSLMITYLKHTSRYKHAQLNKKTLEEIQVLYIKEQERITDFVPIGHRAECIYYRIFRSDESSRWIKTFSEMVKMSDMLDLEELYNLVMQRFESTTPEGVDRVLWGDLRTMFDANTKDELWQNQEIWNLKSWNFYENYRVHTLTLEDSTEIHMLAERKYSLTKETLEGMMSLKLIAKSASESAYNLLSKELASPKKKTLGKDISNPLIVDSLLKTIALSMHHVIAMKHWLFQRKWLLVKKYQIHLWLVVYQKLQGQLSWYCCVAELLRCCDDDKV